MTDQYPPQLGPNYRSPVQPRKRHILRNISIASGIAAVAIVVIAVSVDVSKTPAASSPPAASSTTPAPAAQAPAAPAAPVAAPAAATETASGSANQVITVSGLVPGTTYTLSYTASGSDVNALIVTEGQDNNLVNDINDSGALSGSVLYTADAASITLQISNADGESWTLTFTPQ